MALVTYNEYDYGLFLVQYSSELKKESINYYK